MIKEEEITIKFKKLGKNKALGLAFKEEKIIYLDPKLKGKDFINVLTHELCHLLFPYLIEEEIDNAANVISNILHKYGVVKQEQNSEIFF